MRLQNLGPGPTHLLVHIERQKVRPRGTTLLVAYVHAASQPPHGHPSLLLPTLVNTAAVARQGKAWIAVHVRPLLMCPSFSL